MAEHTWDVTAAEVVSRLRVAAPAPAGDDLTALNDIIANAAATVNEYLVRYTGQTPEAVDALAVADTASSSARVKRMMRRAILAEARGEWVSGSHPELSADYLTRAETYRADLRYALPTARSGLAPETGPDPPSGRLEAPEGWIDVAPDGEAFG